MQIPRRIRNTKEIPLQRPHWQPPIPLPAVVDYGHHRKRKNRQDYKVLPTMPQLTVPHHKNYKKHLLTKCYVSNTKKHKFTCLNEECTTHSWICKNHIEENTPLLTAHHKDSDLHQASTKKTQDTHSPNLQSMQNLGGIRQPQREALYKQTPAEHI